MTNTWITPHQLISFYEDKVSHQTALSYAEEMEKAMTPFITVERRRDGNYNVIGGFKYLNGIRLLRKDIPLYCTIVEPFKSERERKLAMLQRCLTINEKTIYKEVLIHELIHDLNMDQDTISAKLGKDTKKIEKYMYRQVIPREYYHEANKMGVKSFIQAIYLANSFLPNERRLLTELALNKNESSRFQRKHLSLYRRYRKKYDLFDDFASAKEQILRAIRLDKATAEYWKTVPHPNNYRIVFLNLNEGEDPELPLQ